MAKPPKTNRPSGNESHQAAKVHNREKGLSVLKSYLCTALALLCSIMSSTQCCRAQEWTKDPTTWWPDPSTGLMWTGQMHASPHPASKVPGNGTVGVNNGLNWQQANDYCNSLQLAGFTGWRLPTLNEVEAITEIRETTHWFSAMDHELVPYKEIGLKDGIDISLLVWIWTSTLSPPDPQKAWIVSIPGDLKNWPFTRDRTETNGEALCVRSMEPDLLAAATAAQVNHPVPDIQTLQTFIPLNKARMAYQAGNYQESIAQAQIAISLKASPAIAYWGIGISYGRLGQWDQAISNLESALKIDKGYDDAKDSLQWAKANQKAAKHGKTAKDKPPVWK